MDKIDYEQMYKHGKLLLEVVNVANEDIAFAMACIMAIMEIIENKKEQHQSHTTNVNININ